jgi:pimeloyl-ACP methyl ester carboxylesterase
MPRPFEQGRFEDIPESPRRAHAYDEMEAKVVSLESRPFGTIDIHYRELGDGPPLLLLHGLMTSSYSWRYVAKDLAKSFRVIAPDMPGAGASGKPDARYEVDALAVWVRELLAALGIRGCAAIGNSLGGFVMMRAALDEPDAIGRLVNIHSPAFPEARYYALHAALSVPGVRAALARHVRRDPLRWAHANVHYHDETLKSREEARAYGEPLASAEGARAFVRYLSDALAPSGFRGLVRDLESRRSKGLGFPVPLCLIYSRKDPLVRPANGPRLQALVPDADLVWLDDSSHFAHVDTPEALVLAAVPFLAG